MTRFSKRQKAGCALKGRAFGTYAPHFRGKALRPSGEGKGAAGRTIASAIRRRTRMGKQAAGGNELARRFVILGKAGKKMGKESKAKGGAEEKLRDGSCACHPLSTGQRIGWGKGRFRAASA